LFLLQPWALAYFFTPSSPDEALIQQVVSSHIRSLMANHLVDVASTDQHTVKPRFDGKLDFAPPVIDLASKGFHLVGGRLDYLDNRPVAALVYRYQKHIINLFIWPSTSGEDTTPQMTSQQGYNVIYWKQSGMDYWAVSDVGEAQVQQFAHLIQSQTPSTG
jgi:anti-sigma factor RsiW